MTIEEILSKILTHLHKGLNFHNQMTNAFGFLKLAGYQKDQESHYYEENHNYRELQNYIINQYNKIIPEEREENLEVIPSSWYKYVSEGVDSSTKRGAIRDLMKKWIDWETETIKLLKNSYNEARNLNELYMADKILEIIKETVEELISAKNELIMLETTNFDIVFIAERQIRNE